MRLTLVTEGTYPHFHGGVSVWCDQLLTGTPEYEFDVYAITDTSGRLPVWDAPPNVTNIGSVAIWEPAPKSRRGLGNVEWDRFELAGRDLLLSIFADPRQGSHGFLKAIRGMAELAPEIPLSTAIRSERFLRLLVDVWDEFPIEGRGGDVPPRSLLDALVARDYLERFLRPLSIPPQRSDIVHSSANGLGALVGMMAKWQHGTPFILTEHGIYLRERYLARNDSHSWHVDTFMLRFFRHLTSSAYLVADLITPGNLYNQRWELHSGAPQALIQRVYNGADPEAFPEIDEEPAVPTVAWAGRVDPLKDLETLIQGFALVRREIPDARLRMFGATPAGNEDYREQCEDLVDMLDLRDVATFEGRVVNIADAYRAGHVVALTSISEGFPYTIIEAMMSGSATVSTDVGGVAEAVADTGMLVPARNPEALAESIIVLLRDDTLRRRLARAARDRALEFFTLDESIAAYRDLYERLAEGFEADFDANQTPDRHPAAQVVGDVATDTIYVKTRSLVDMAHATVDAGVGIDSSQDTAVEE